jgi:glyoxylase-like metal-dependent hydrolase (beta-lactamase superfamily II)
MSDHVLTQLTPRVWWLNPVSATDRPTLGVIVGERGSLVVDAGNSPAHAGALRAAMARHDLPAPRLIALTHWHWDHVFGAATLDVPALASHETQRVLGLMAAMDWGDQALDQRVEAGVEIAFCRDMIKAELPDRSGLLIRPPEIGLADALTLNLGDVTCRLIHVGGDHSPDAITVHVPEERVAFIGDAIYDDLYHGPRRLTARLLFPLLDRLLALDAAYYVAGHDTEPIGREQFARDAAELRAIGALVGRIGDDHDAVVAALPAALGAQPDAGHHEIAAAFLAGLRLPEVASPL